MKMTWKKLTTMIAVGYGQGHGNDYKPFLQITRRNTSKESNQSTGAWLFGYTREFHYFARGEKQIALGLWWLGATDVREQLPFWPVTHAHPLAGAPGTESMDLPQVPGTLALAKHAGIEHGIFPGSKVPYVATMDLMVTVHRKGVADLVPVSCKPREIADNADPASRMLERLELERLYCNALHLPRHLADVDAFGKPLLANLSWLMPDQSTSTRLRRDPRLRHLRDALCDRMHDTPLDRVISEAAASLQWPVSEGNAAFRHLAWHQFIDIDLSSPIAMTQPARPGGIRLRDALRMNILGEIDHAQL